MPDPNSPEFPEWVANQSFNLTDITGTSDTFNLPIIDQFIQWTGRSLIIFGLNIGLTAMMTVVLLLLTKPEKRRTPVFALNLSGLILQFLRNVLVSILYDGPTRHIGVFFLGATSTVSTAEISPVYIYTVITMFWYILIISSLVVQVRVVFGAEAKARLYLTLGFALLGLTTVAFVLTQQADIFKFTLEANGGADSWYDWVSITGRILWAIVIGLCSAVFVGKLIYLIHRRQKMGFKGFGPLQVILIMGSQCLIVPRIHLTLLSLIYSCLRDCRFLLRHRWLRYHRRNILNLFSSSLSSLGLRRSRKSLRYPSQTLIRKLERHKFFYRN